MNASTKIVVLGESGVGKSTLVAALSKSFGDNIESTVGAAVSMTWHDYRAGSAEQRTELIELWDIGGTTAHRPASTVFLDGAAGVILVHDLANSKSEANLGQWLALLNGDRRMTSTHTLRTLVADIESTQIPIVIVGTRLDLAPHRNNTSLISPAPRVSLDCRKEILPGTTHAMTLSRFFDAAIDRSRGPSDPRRRRLIVS